MSEPFARGTLVGERFRLDVPANDVGLGEPWIALDITTGDLALAKFFSPAAGFEALQAGAPLAGPQVLPIRALGTHGDRPWTATDVPEGVALSRWIDEQRESVGYIPLASVRAIATALCSAMATAHRRPSPPWNVHGALSPVSTFVCFDATGACDLQIADAGLLPFAASPPAPWGAPWFPLAPELDADPRRATAATDIFCIAAMLLEALSPRPIRAEALRVRAETPTAWARWHASLRADVDATVWSLLYDALSPDPRTRPQNADQLARRVREARWSPVADDPRPKPPARPVAPVAHDPPAARPPMPSKTPAPAPAVPIVAATPPTPPEPVHDTLVSVHEPRPDATLLADDAAWAGAALRAGSNATIIANSLGPSEVPHAAAPPDSSPNATVLATELGADELLRFMRPDETLSAQGVRRPSIPASPPAIPVTPAAPSALPPAAPTGLSSGPPTSSLPRARPQQVPRWMIGAVVTLVAIIVASVALLLTQ